MRSIPTITKNLLLANIAIFLLTWLSGKYGVDINGDFGLHYVGFETFRPWQFLTYMFLHGSVEHLFFNMFALWMFGSIVERAWGERRFLVYYLVCGLGAGVMQELSQFVVSQVAFGLFDATTVGASGAIYGILLAFGMTWPEERMFIFPLPIPIKAKWFICGYIVIEIYLALSAPGDGVAHIAHLGGMLFGFFLFKHWKRGGQFGMSFRMPNIKFSKPTAQASDERNKDWEYNQRQQTREEEIDRILDKVRRNGYESLTDEEKRKLFEK